MSLLIVSLLAISCVSGSFGVIYPIPQPILPYSTFQPAANQFNPPVVPFNPPAGQFNPSAVPFNPTAGQFDPSADQFPSPVNPRFNSFEPNFQISNPFQASVSVTAPSPSSNMNRKFNDVVRDFSKHFIRSLIRLPKYKNAFDLHNLSKEKAVSIYYDRVRDESARAGEKDPDFSGYSASRGVKDNYDAANSEYHMKVFGFGLGEFLYQRGVLTADNAIELSDRLSQTMKDNIDANVNPSSEDNLVAIIRGCEKYLTELNAFGADASYAAVAIFSEMWYILRECYKGAVTAQSNVV